MKLTSHSRNIIFIYLGDAASRLLGLVAVSYLARVLGPSDFGTISIGLAVLAYAMVLGNSGLKLLGTRKVAGETQNIESLTANIIIARLLLSAITFSLGVYIIYVFVASQEVFHITRVYLLGVFPAALLLEWFFHGKRKLGIIAGGKIISMFFYLVIVLLFVKNNKDIIWVAWAWIIGIAANCAFLWFIFKQKKYTVSFQRDKLKVRSLLLEAFPLGVAIIIAQITTQFPPIYLGLVATKSDVGFFTAAFKVILFLLILDRVFYSVFFPNISRCFNNFPDKLEAHVNAVLKITTVSVLMIGLYAVVSGHYIIHFIFGSSFMHAVPIFQVLVGYFVLNLINSVFTFTLIGMEKEKIYTRSLVNGMVVFFIVTFIVTEFMGTIGVACGLIAYQLTSLIIMAAALKRHILLNYIRSIILPVTGTILLSVPLLLFADLVFFVKIIIITLIGFPYIIWLGGIGKDELYYLKRKFI